MAGLRSPRIPIPDVEELNGEAARRATAGPIPVGDAAELRGVRADNVVRMATGPAAAAWSGSRLKI